MANTKYIMLLVELMSIYLFTQEILKKNLTFFGVSDGDFGDLENWQLFTSAQFVNFFP